MAWNRKPFDRQRRDLADKRGHHAQHGQPGGQAKIAASHHATFGAADALRTADCENKSGGSLARRRSIAGRTFSLVVA